MVDGHSGDISITDIMEEPGFGSTINLMPTVEKFEEHKYTLNDNDHLFFL